jgi:hypothetical protein
MLDLFRTLPALVSDPEGSAAIREALVFAAWRKIAGEALAAHTVPLKLQDSTLIVAVASLTWQRHLKDLAGQMLFKVNAALGSPMVSYIQLDIDDAVVREERARRGLIDETEARRMAEQEITPDLVLAAAKIEDEELRQQFLAAAGNCLVRKRRKLEVNRQS